MNPREELARNLMRVAERDAEAFDAVYHATSAKLFGIVIRILRRREVAEEVLQDVYMRIWERAADFDPSMGSPITWMATVARNRALDEARRATTVPFNDERDLEDVPDGEPDALAQVELAEDHQKLRNCLDGLGAQKREMIILAYREGLSRESLSKRYNAPVGTIKTWLRRSLAQLKNCLGS